LRQRFGVPIPPDTAGDKLLNITGASIQSLAAFGREGTLLALAQIVAIAPTTAEVGIMVRSDHKKRGIGRALLAALVNEARAAHLIELRATVLRENLAMCGLARKVGFVTFGSSGLVIEFRFIL
jgi:GNAT superfamily N-acetyltransferase